MGTHPIFESDFDCLTEKMENLIEMGFPVNACKRAMYFCDGNIEAAMEWLCSHMDDPDYNTDSIEPPKENEAATIPQRPDVSSLPEKFKVFTSEIIESINFPNKNTKIYKEECTLSCDTVYSPQGIFICLKTFFAYGVDIKNSIPDNRCYLNICTIREVKDQSDE